ncbi:sigma-70 family RNA polymerase sigma factor [Aneurinibacillus sp. BA2021]|nr:sigma-70 family RNA polymerase sigma factor [Aneurinibacillus sp. BA2021]
MEEWQWTQFFAEYDAWLDRCVSRFPPGVWRDEAKQAARIACWRRLAHYNAEKGMALSSYLFLVSKGGMANWYAGERRWQERHCLFSTRLGTQEEEKSWADTLVGADARDIEEELIWQAWMSDLSAEEARCLTLHIRDGLSLREVAEHLHVPYERVKKQKQRTLRKLRRRIEAEREE